MAEQDKQFDIFISYVDVDELWAKWIAWELEDVGYTCMLRQWDIRAGQNKIAEIDKAVQQAKRVMLLLSPNYLESEERKPEWTAAIERYTTTDQELLLPVLVHKGKIGGLLSPFQAIELVGLTEEEARQRLLAGVRNERHKPLQRPPFPGTPDKVSAAPLFPGRSSSHNVTPHPPGKNILIVSLGESPIVATAMYDILTKNNHLAFEKVIVLCPSGVVKAYNLVLDTFAQPELLEYEGLDFEDLNSSRTAVQYLQCLYKILDRYEQVGDQVYLALAGGRKSMAALMAWVVPFFSCVKTLYHLLEKVEGTTLLDTDDVAREYPSRRRELMHPDPDKFDLVEIPQPAERQFNPKFEQFLLSATDEDIERWSNEDQLRFFFAKEVVNPNSSPLELRFTEAVLQMYEVLENEKPDVARQLYKSFGRMTDAERLRQLTEGAFSYKQSISQRGVGRKANSEETRVAKLHFYKDQFVPLWPVFYTWPGDISKSQDEHAVEQVIVCALGEAQRDRRKVLETVTVEPDFSLFPVSDVQWPLAKRVIEHKKSVLIVPLGMSPMVATQLFTLLSAQEGRFIDKVILIYPKLNHIIKSGAELIEQVLSVKCQPGHCIFEEIPHLEDIRTDEHCRKYQQHLEGVIKDVKEHLREHTIDLALSGGRKGMTAMTIFAAQEQRIPFVYHTLIRDQKLSEKIEEETKIETLSLISDEELHERLFLRAYDKSEKYNKFVLFKVPVFPAAPR